MLGFLRYFKKAAKIKGKLKRPGEAAEPIDRSIYRIGIFGHKDVGKTVFLTAVYAFFKDSSVLQLMAMGETQAFLEENFNLMNGKGTDQITGQRIESRRFPGSSTEERKLSFSAQLGKTFNVSLEILDYSGKNLYIDSAGEPQQELLNYFQFCDCVLFFIDPDATKNEGELTKRIASFTHLINQLAGRKKRLSIPIGLVITKSDELQGFKSGLQSTLIGDNVGFIKGQRFNDFMNGIVRQKYLADYPEWKNSLQAIMSRFQSLFNPLIKSTLDYQVFFVSSTGNTPQTAESEQRRTIKIPPGDFRPLGVNQPIEWALRRISACRRAAVFSGILKWSFFFALLAVILTASANIYNKTKIDDLVYRVNNLKLDRLEAYSGLANAFSSYSDNFIVKLFFGDFRRVSNEKYAHFAGVSGDDRIRGQFERFGMVKDSVTVLLSIANEPASDSISYNNALASLGSLIDVADDLERSIKTQGYSTTWMVGDIRSWKGTLANMPSAKDHQTVSKLIADYTRLKQDFDRNLADKKYIYLLDLADQKQFPGKLSELKTKLDEFAKTPGVDKYIQKADNYLNLVKKLDKNGAYVFFTVSGADPSSNGYYITFGQQQGFPEGALDASSRERIRIPAKDDVEVKLHEVSKSVAVDNCIIPSGFEILSWNNKSLCFKNRNLNIKLRFDLDDFDSSLKNEL